MSVLEVLFRKYSVSCWTAAVKCHSVGWMMVVQVQLLSVISQELFGCSCCFQHSFTFTFVLGGHSASQKPVPVLPRSRSQRFSLVFGQYRWFWQPCDFKALCYLKNLETNTTLLSLYMESAALTWHSSTNNSLCRCLFLLCAWPFQYCCLYQWCGVTDHTTTVTAVTVCHWLISAHTPQPSL